MCVHSAHPQKEKTHIVYIERAIYVLFTEICAWKTEVMTPRTVVLLLVAPGVACLRSTSWFSSTAANGALRISSPKRSGVPHLQHMEPEWLDALVDNSAGTSTAKASKSRPRRRKDGQIGKPKPKPSKIAKRRTACYGCGADLQTEAIYAAGYVDPERYELKASHKQLKLLLCNRCRSLAQGEILPAVLEGRLRAASSVDSAVGAAVGVTTPEALREELKMVRELKCLVVLLVDVTDVTGSFLPRVRDLVGGNPIILVGTKADLLPKGTELAHGARADGSHAPCVPHPVCRTPCAAPRVPHLGCAAPCPLCPVCCASRAVASVPRRVCPATHLATHDLVRFRRPITAWRASPQWRRGSLGVCRRG